MSAGMELQCRCGQFALAVVDAPICSVACCCSSCRQAGEKLQALPGAKPILDTYGTTHFVMYRKDRVMFTRGVEYLREFRLLPKSKTRRVVAVCCNSPVFVELKDGHWFSLYGSLWGQEHRPAVQLRTMVGDLPDPAVLPSDVPNLRKHSLGFYWSLLRAWAEMKFRTPVISTFGELDA